VAEQVIILMAATGGAFDHLIGETVAEAIHALLSKIKKDHDKLMDSLNKGDKPVEEDVATVVKAAVAIAKSFDKE
jgi:F0F1-type ATP synthase alpha subunit